jgi:hypothetical protein
MGGLKFDGKNETVINNKYRIWVTCNWKSLSAHRRHQILFAVFSTSLRPVFLIIDHCERLAPHAETRRRKSREHPERQFSEAATVCYVLGRGLLLSGRISGYRNNEARVFCRAKSGCHQPRVYSRCAGIPGYRIRGRQRPREVRNG